MLFLGPDFWKTIMIAWEVWKYVLAGYEPLGYRDTEKMDALAMCIGP